MKNASNPKVRKASKKIISEYAGVFRSLKNTKPWKKHGEVRLNPDNSIDEICIKNCDFHLEQMSDGHWWIGVYTGPRTGVKPKYGKKRNHKDMMHIRLYHPTDKPVHVNCESDDGIICEGIFNK